MSTSDSANNLFNNLVLFLIIIHCLRPRARETRPYSGLKVAAPTFRVPLPSTTSKKIKMTGGPHRGL